MIWKLLIFTWGDFSHIECIVIQIHSFHKHVVNKFLLKCIRFPIEYRFLLELNSLSFSILNETYNENVYAWKCLRPCVLSPPLYILFSSSFAGCNGFTIAAAVLVAFLQAMRNSARVILRHRSWIFCSSHTTISTDERPTQDTCPESRISESY